ncbi:MAG: IS21 family transposase [bacterium]|nr:IS21 family transposase [bacterium]
MTVSKEVEGKIRRLHYAEHWKVGTIVAQLGVHRDVVRRVLGLTEPRRESRLRAKLIDPYVGFIEETLRAYPKLRATRLYDMLKTRGYRGSVRTVRSYVRLVRPKPKNRAFLRTEPLCAEQAQVDWAHVGRVLVAGGNRALWLFVMVLSYSRAIWGEFVYDLSVHSLRRSLVRASRYFGGSPRQWLFDNPKTVVLERDGDAVRFHPGLLELCGKMCVQPRLCAVRQPQEKGRVERSIRYARDRFLAGRRIESIEQGNREFLAFLDEIALERPHPRFRDRSVRSVLDEERATLLRLPDPLPRVDQVELVAVDKTAFIRFDTNSYSVPPRFASEKLTLIADDGVIRLSTKDEEVAHHERSWGRRQVLENPEHRAELLTERRAARDLKGRDRLRSQIPQIETLFARWLENGHHLAPHVARAVKLLDLYDPTIITDAVDELVTRGIRDPSALLFVCDRLRRERNRPMPREVVLPDHVEDRDVIPHALEDYDG